MFKNLSEKVGVVTGVVVTNSIEMAKANKVAIAVNFAVNLLAQDNAKEAVKKTVKHTAIAAGVGGVVKTAIEYPQLKEVLGELDNEENEVEVEEENWEVGFSVEEEK